MAGRIKEIWRRLKNRMSLGAVMSMLIGVGEWLREGGLSVPSPIPPGYWIGMGLIILGVILGIVGWVKNPPKKDKKLGLHDIVPTLQQMDSFLSTQANIVAKKPFDKQGLIRLITGINMEAFHFTEQDIDRIRNVTKTGQVRAISSEVQKRVVNDFLNKTVIWDEVALTLAGAVDYQGYGLKEVKSKGTYPHLKNTLAACRNEVADDVLNREIERHVADSEVFNTLLVLKDRLPVADVPVKVEDGDVTATSLVSYWMLARFETADLRLNKRMSETRNNINKRIRFLESRNTNRGHGQKRAKKNRTQQESRTKRER